MGASRDYFLLDTAIENIFINEYLPVAPGDFVKVYIYMLFLAKNDIKSDLEVTAKHLLLDEKRITEALEYWVEKGVINKLSDGEEDIYEFVNLREKIYGNCIMKTEPKKKDATGEGSFEEENKSVEKIGVEDVKELLEYAESVLGKPLSAKELREIGSWVTEIGATKELATGVIDYCAEMGKLSVNYMAKVLIQWHEDGLKSTEDINTRLSEVSERHGDYRRILNMLGLNRNITVPEKRLVDCWMDEMHFEINKIMEACEKASFTANPNLKYVNKVLENWKQEADNLGRDVNSTLNVNPSTLNKYYEHIRREAEASAETRKEEVYKNNPEIRQIDINLRNLSSKISRGLLGGLSRQSIEEIKKEAKRLEQERAILLTENNFPYDYTDIKYLCNKCNDTGIDDSGQRCSCSKERMGEASLWQDGKL